MAILPLVLHPDEILQQKCKKVTTFDLELATLLDNMYETMIKHDGVGLAAPQIGILEQIAVVDIGDESGRIELINPEIITKRGKQTDIEGCLSIPKLYGDVTRAYYVKVKARNRQGKAFILEAEDYLARAIQHEIDHLHGILFTTKVEKIYTLEELEELDVQ
ncbi:peptide deformylase [Caldibacillus lycopersici]|uniref:Peptide deformylase n=1 Tax=Perspicuibacillus lycopersici TaxID=1325689 RepID=A0AAE3LPA9_9BACI|nr:peptide deformylase [Perspicuibacillus lycopersici]MCU9612159.1 peptide deformylase [Perspicuibacillus lycopersici]